MGSGFYFLRGSFSSEVSLGLLFSHLVKSDISRKDRIEKEFGQGRKQRNSQEEKKKQFFVKQHLKQNVPLLLWLLLDTEDGR